MADLLTARLAAPISALGVLFVVVVLGTLLAPPDSPVAPILTAAAWVLWAIFVVDFVLRLVVAPSTAAFLRRNWWQIVLLVVPFLRFLALARVSRATRGLASAVRAGRSAGRRLTARIGWLLTATLIVVLATGELLVAYGEFETLAKALHATAMATIAGEPMGGDSGLVQALDVVLGGYSVVVVATLAGSLGAFFLEPKRTSPAL